MKLTPARQVALEVLANAHPALCRESNTTSLRLHYVYWQSSKWFVAEGLAYFPSGSTMLALTVAGVELAKERGLL